MTSTRPGASWGWAGTGEHVRAEKAFSASDIDGLRRHGQSGAAATAGAVQDVMPAAANPYFRAQRVFGRGAARLEALVRRRRGAIGQGQLEGDGWDLAIERGTTLVVPWGAGPVRTTGDVELLRCLPPLPEDAKSDDPTA